MGWWNTIRASIDPQSILREYREPDAVKDIYGRPAEPLAFNAVRPITAAGQRIRLNNADDIMGLRNRVYCLHTDTEILTKNGWKTHDQLVVGEHVWTLDMKTQLAEWQPVQAVNVFDVVDMPMHRYKSRTHESFCTPDHRWFGFKRMSHGNRLVPEVRTSEQITSSQFMVPIAARAAVLPTVAKYEDDYVALIAWMFTEGNIEPRKERILRPGEYRRRLGSISQYRTVNPDNWNEIRAILTRLFGPESVPFKPVDYPGHRRVHSPRWYSQRDKQFRINEEIIRTVEDDLQGAEVKCPSREFIYALTSSQLRLFIDTCIKADGWVNRKTGASGFSQNRLDRLEIFELACHLLGMAVTRMKPTIGRSSTQYICNLRERTVTILSDAIRTIENFTGQVWCPTVDNHVWFARYQGKTFWTHNTDWQNDAWAYYEAIGEIKYGFGLVGSCMSRMRLYPSITVDEDDVPMPISAYINILKEEQNNPAAETSSVPQLPEDVTPEVMQFMVTLLRDLRSGSGGVAGLLRMFAINLSVAGECYLVKVKGKWYIKSTSELIVNQGGVIILRSQRAGSSTTTAGTVYGDVILPANTPIYRIWREHPRYSHEPESSMLGLREICDEIVTLQRMIRTTARSRTNAGVLYVPDGVTVAGDSLSEDMASEQEEGDILAAAIYDTMTAPLIDEANAATVMPLLLTGPGEEAKNVIHIAINRAVDQFLVQRADKALERLASGMDLPKDALSGQQRGMIREMNARYQRQVQNQMYAEHIEPLTLILCDALSSMYLRPAIKRKFPYISPDSLEMLGLWYDPSDLVIAPNDSQAADQGFTGGALSGAAWRIANGFSDSDAPSERELLLRAFLKMPFQPDQAEMFGQYLFPDVTNSARQQNLANSPVPMPQSAQELLYPGDGPLQTTQEQLNSKGVGGDAPTGPQTYTNANNQENSGTSTKDLNLNPAGMTRNPSVGVGGYGDYR